MGRCLDRKEIESLSDYKSIFDALNKCDQILFDWGQRVCKDMNRDGWAATVFPEKSIPQRRHDGYPTRINSHCNLG